MKKLKVSASQISKFRSCRRAYAFEYVEKIRPPSSPKQQFGTDVHAYLEQWISKSTLPGNDPAGELAKLAITKQLIPTPDPRLLVEDEFVYPWNEEVDVGGFIDLTIPPEMDEDCIPTITDYKTTSDLRWAKTPEQLEQDEQTILYSIRGMIKFNTPVVRCRWVYMSATAPKSGNRKPNGTKECSIMFDSRDEMFRLKLKRMDEDIQEMARIRKLHIKGLSLPPSPESCGAYGGCFHRVTCNLTPSETLGSFMERENTMHLKK